MQDLGEAGAGRGDWSAARRVVAWTAFPLTLAAALWATRALMARGVEPALAYGLVTGASMLWVMALERVFPHRHEWLHSRGDLRVDVAFAATVGVWLALLGPVITALGIALGGALSARFGAGLWPTGWPWPAQVALALVLAELPKYWLHRGMHELDWLWRFHAVHHSVPRLYWLNASRFHPVDIGLDAAVGLAPLVALGCPEPVLALFLLVSGVHGFFQHANLSLRCGPLNWFFSMAELHRWHHSRPAALANHNYGQNVIVWDAVFGTRFLPRDREPEADIGLEDLPDFPTDFAGQLAAPFRWSRLRRRPGSVLAGSR